ncbi:hypothetical protein [Actinoplanes sp. NBRC 101535]|uniref:hypothetical protein n=1 Tax=Actinoplanes sp. NBRC 101535 TaxID=3032196 RepID=UPI0024A56C0C|nr:hypothetical protein [Actinoplanes sp. NBRC 101535]GLY08247.1 hypothetical protein Acsp01_86260 [Actinoplanes sp. NBRC 101535]
MNRQQMLAAAAAATRTWTEEHADSVPADPGDSAPHAGPGGPSDYAEHHAARSAPAAVDDLLSNQLLDLIGRHRASLAKKA